MNTLITLDEQKDYLVSSAVDIAIPVFLYGVYSVLYGTCIIILRRNGTPNGFRYVIAMTLLFILATASVFVNSVLVVLDAFYMYEFIGTGKTPPLPIFELTRGSLSLYITSNVVADVILVSRCYLIWNQSLLVVIFPTLLCLASNAVGMVYIWSHMTDFTAIFLGDNSSLIKFALPFILLDLCSNLLLTLLIAGKIFLVVRETRNITGIHGPNTYSSLIAIMYVTNVKGGLWILNPSVRSVESGVLYPVALIILLFFHRNSVIFSLVQIVGIAPTLIIVRVGLGTALPDVKGCIETVHVASRVRKVLDATSSGDEIMVEICRTKEANDTPC
ncbi:hypothetical protein E1B28_012988 [Marasmius oreades]|uniref:Uncharacterized protein n=1 Tax=Marasmius oreades TaxID=181124 RepID=A0A9P7RPM0_9AGAR|nr:uncharacterized protein E1B28_012988 [Marasmius oreades]KAG7087010.1 hypothetical protein E1B28_012988 [Marasmius oreades]